EQFLEATLKYHEPAPEVVGPLQNLLDTVPINKLMAIGDARAITALRWQLNAQLNGTVKLVQANSREMVEILPPGASKGAAAKTLIREMKTAPENVMAMGDGENDIELLQNVGLGITVGNAEPKLKQIARWVIG